MDVTLGFTVIAVIAGAYQKAHDRPSACAVANALVVAKSDDIGVDTWLAAME